MYVYIIECADGSLYTGIAKDVVARLREHYHRLPGCAKYTRSHQMVGIRAVWQTEDRSAEGRSQGEKVTACQLEYRIKRLSRKQKDSLIIQPENLAMMPINGKAEWIPKEEQEKIMTQVKNI